MKPLREWLESEVDLTRQTFPGSGDAMDTSFRNGWVSGLLSVLKELKAREDAERESGNSPVTCSRCHAILRVGLCCECVRYEMNLNALDRYAGEVLEEKEGGAE